MSKGSWRRRSQLSEAEQEARWEMAGLNRILLRNRHIWVGNENKGPSCERCGRLWSDAAISEVCPEAPPSELSDC